MSFPSSLKVLLAGKDPEVAAALQPLLEAHWSRREKAWADEVVDPKLQETEIVVEDGKEVCRALPDRQVFLDDLEKDLAALDAKIRAIDPTVDALAL